MHYLCSSGAENLAVNCGNNGDTDPDGGDDGDDDSTADQANEG
jgi:hypothetical protein